MAETDRDIGGATRPGLKLVAVVAELRRGRGAGVGLNDNGITFSRLRAVELAGMGMLAERDCRVDMLDDGVVVV